MAFNFYIKECPQTLLRAFSETLSQKLIQNGNHTADIHKGDVCTIALRAKKAYGKRSSVFVYAHKSLKDIAENAAKAAAETFGFEYAGFSEIRGNTSRRQIITEFRLTAMGAEQIMKNCGAAADAVCKALIDRNSHIAENTEEFEEYLKANPSKGYMEIHVYSGRSPIPVPGAKVTVSKTLSERYVLSEVFTDSSGRTERIVLPTKPGAVSQSPEGESPYAFYDIMTEKPGYIITKNLNVPVFENILSVQPVRMNADTGGGEDIFDEGGSYNL